jgi:hypothetical protein
MPWEADGLVPGSAAHVEGHTYSVVGVRYRVGPVQCPPYVGIAGGVAPRLPIDTTTQEIDGVATTVWWVSHLRVEIDAAPLRKDVTYPGTAQA